MLLCRVTLLLLQKTPSLRTERGRFTRPKRYSIVSDFATWNFSKINSGFFSRPYSLITAMQILMSKGIKKNPSKTHVYDGFFSSYSVLGYFSVKTGRLSSPCLCCAFFFSMNYSGFTSRGQAFLSWKKPMTLCTRVQVLIFSSFPNRP